MVVGRIRKLVEEFRREVEAQNARPSAAERVAANPPHFVPAGSFEWQLLHAPPRQIYGDAANPYIANLLRFAPGFALEIGCNTGTLGQSIKQQFPAAVVWGVEPNEVTADIARTRLDQVLNRKLEEINWDAEGVCHGEIDTVFLFDVLEHIFDPWGTLLTLRNLVSSNAQLIVSVPNVRNVFLIQDLINGHWRYREMGLLDITHIRFFTAQDMMRMFYQTGFRVMARTFTLCEKSQAVYGEMAGGKFPKVLELEGATITVRSEEDLVGLCAMQHIFNLAPVEYAQLTDDERQWIDAPHPETHAYAGARP